MTIIEAILRTNAVLYILDPKNAGLTDLGTVMDKVYFENLVLISFVRKNITGMLPRLRRFAPAT